MASDRSIRQSSAFRNRGSERHDVETTRADASTNPSAHSRKLVRSRSRDTLMAYEKKPGDVSLFETEKMGRESAPDHQGYFIAHRDIKAGEKIAIALWAGRANSSRSFGGKVSDLTNPQPSQPKPTDLFGNPVSIDKNGKGRR